MSQSVQNGELHLYVDDSIMDAIALTVDLADFTAMQEALLI